MSRHSPTVFAGVDGSAPAAEAARAAAREAQLRGVRLRVVRAFHWPAGDLAGLPDPYEAARASRHVANLDLGRLRSELTGTSPEWSVGVELVDGRPDRVLCGVVQPGDLLVVGASGLGWGSDDGLGSVAEAVATAAPCPVLVHRTAHPLGAHRRGVVVGVDGAEGSGAVLAAAATEARLRHEPLTVVHAWRQLTEDAVHPLHWRLDARAGSAAETAAVEPLVAELRERDPGLPVDVAVERGRAGRVLVQAAEQASLLVVGRRDAPSGGPGATVHAVLHRVRVPLLTVPVTVAAPGRAVPVAAVDGAAGD